MAGAHGPRRPVHVGAHIPLLRHERLTGVDTDAHPHSPVGERVLGLGCRGDRVAGARERDEERVPCVSTSTPPCRENASRSSRRCSASTSA